MPRVTVILPCYNHGQYVGQAIESVLNQTYQDFELIITNDGSTDETVAACQPYLSERVRLFSFAKNQGIAVSYNHCISQGVGEFVAVLDADNIFYPDKLEKQVNFLDQHPKMGAVLGYAKIIDQRGNDFPDPTHIYQRIFIKNNRSRFAWLNHFFFKGNCLCNPSALIRRSCYETVGLYHPCFFQLHDFDFWVRFCLEYDLQILPENLIQFRILDNEANCSGNRPEKNLRGLFEFILILNHYLTPVVDENFSQIFPGETPAPGGDAHQNLFHFLITQIALKHNRRSHNYFAIQTLYKLLENPLSAAQILSAYGFGFSDLIKLTGERDVFQLVTVDQLQTQLIEAQTEIQKLKQQLAAVTPSPAPVELPEPDWNLAELSALIQAYHQVASYGLTLSQLRDLRRTLAETWLKLPSEKLQSAYQGKLGEVHQLFVTSGIKLEPLTAEETRFIQPLIEQLTAASFKETQAVQILLAINLYQFADQISLKYEAAAIPKWFFQPFLTILFEKRVYFHQPIEVVHYCQYWQKMIHYFSQQSLNFLPANLALELATFLSERITLDSLWISDIDLNPIYGQWSQTIATFLQHKNAALAFNFPHQNSAKAGKIRCGILLENISPSPATFAVISLLETLSLDNFEITLYYFDIQDHNLGSYCQKQVNHFSPLANGLNSQAQILRHPHLDLLIFASDHLSPGILQLLHHRLARRQLWLTTAIPLTPPLPNLDGYLMGEILIPQQSLPSVQLISLPGSGLQFPDPQPHRPQVTPTRRSWGATDTTIIYFSGVPAIYLTPSVRLSWIKILQAVPDALLVLYPFAPQTGDIPPGLFFQQMQILFRDHGLDPKRFVIIRPLPQRADVQACVQLADIYLHSTPDPGAGMVSFALAAGVPPVVPEGTTLRHQQAAALLRDWQLPELITPNEESYIELGIQLGKQATLRQHYRQRLQSLKNGNFGKTSNPDQGLKTWYQTQFFSPKNPEPSSPMEPPPGKKRPACLDSDFSGTID